MEINFYLKILKQFYFIIILFVLIGGLLGLFYGRKITSDIKLEQSYYIKSPQLTQSEIDVYSGYWSQEKARNFTDTALTIIQNPQFKSEFIKSQGNYDAKKSAPQLIKVNINAPNNQEAINISKDIEAGFNNKISQLTQSESYKLIPLAEKLQSTYPGPSKNAVILAGILLGFLFSIFTIGIVKYLKL